MRADRLTLRAETNAPSRIVAPRRTGNAADDLAVQRIVMGDGRHAGQQILEAADEQPIAQRIRAVPRESPDRAAERGRRSSIHAGGVLVASRRFSRP